MDKMMQAYNKFNDSNEGATNLQYFQAGYTASATSMRERALAVVSAIDTELTDDVKNHLLTKIGELSDIEP